MQRVCTFYVCDVPLNEACAQVRVKRHWLDRSKWCAIRIRSRVCLFSFRELPKWNGRRMHDQGEKRLHFGFALLGCCLEWKRTGTEVPLWLTLALLSSSTTSQKEGNTWLWLGRWQRAPPPKEEASGSPAAKQNQAKCDI